jgi:hypothetical protein
MYAIYKLRDTWWRSWLRICATSRTVKVSVPAGVTGIRLQSNNSFQKVHTAYTTAPHNHSQHNQASSHEVLTSLILVLLMMGIMMPETCWDSFNSRNIHLIIVVTVGSIIHLHVHVYNKCKCTSNYCCICWFYYLPTCTIYNKCKCKLN